MKTQRQSEYKQCPLKMSGDVRIKIQRGKRYARATIKLALLKKESKGN